MEFFAPVSASVSVSVSVLICRESVSEKAQDFRNIPDFASGEFRSDRAGQRETHAKTANSVEKVLGRARLDSEQNHHDVAATLAYLVDGSRCSESARRLSGMPDYKEFSKMITHRVLQHRS